MRSSGASFVEFVRFEQKKKLTKGTLLFGAFSFIVEHKAGGESKQNVNEAAELHNVLKRVVLSVQGNQKTSDAEVGF